MSINIIFPACDYVEEISIKYEKYEQYFRVKIKQGDIETYLNFNDVDHLSTNLGTEMIDDPTSSSVVIRHPVTTNVQTWLYEEDETLFCFIGFEHLQPRVRIRLEDIELMKSLLTGYTTIWKTENRFFKKPSFCNHNCYRFV